MKLSVAIANKIASPSAFVVWRGFAESISKAAEFGFHGVELALKEKNDINSDELRKLLATHRLEVSGISTGQIFSESKLFLTDPDRDRRKKTESVLKSLIDLASEFGGIVNLGRVRGFISEHQTKKESESLFIDSLSTLASYALQRGVQLVIEPINRYETNFINTVEQCARLLNLHSFDNVGIMPDTFHMNIEEDVIGATLIEFSPFIKYIHVADSNRKSPGCGHLDFQDIFDSLEKSGYDGWISVEVLPFPDPDTAAKRSADFLLPFVNRIKIENLR